MLLGRPTSSSSIPIILKCHFILCATHGASRERLFLCPLLLAEGIVEARMMTTETPSSFRAPILRAEMADIEPKPCTAADGSSRSNAEIAIVARAIRQLLLAQSYRCPTSYSTVGKRRHRRLQRMPPMALGTSAWHAQMSLVLIVWPTLKVSLSKTTVVQYLF